MRNEDSLLPVRGRAQPSRLAAAATIAVMVVLVTFMVIATSWSVARL